jgi:hypothetical protein
MQPTAHPTSEPSGSPSTLPSTQPTSEPSFRPSGQPSSLPSSQPTNQPSSKPSSQPSNQPSSEPSGRPSPLPSSLPSAMPTSSPTNVNYISDIEVLTKSVSGGEGSRRHRKLHSLSSLSSLSSIAAGSTSSTAISDGSSTTVAVTQQRFFIADSINNDVWSFYIYSSLSSYYNIELEGINFDLDFFSHPQYVAADENDNVYVVDDNGISKTSSNQSEPLLYGNFIGLAVSASSNVSHVYTVNSSNYETLQISMWDDSSLSIAVLADDFIYPHSLAIDSADSFLYVGCGDGTIYKLDVLTGRKSFYHSITLTGRFSPLS